MLSIRQKWPGGKRNKNILFYMHLNDFISLNLLKLIQIQLRDKIISFYMYLNVLISLIKPAVYVHIAKL